MIFLEEEAGAGSTERRVRQGPAMLIATEETWEGYGHSGQVLLRADGEFTVVSSFRHFSLVFSFFKNLKNTPVRVCGQWK